jgi:hypothetical protein
VVNIEQTLSVQLLHSIEVPLAGWLGSTVLRRRAHMLLQVQTTQHCDSVIVATVIKGAVRLFDEPSRLAAVQLYESVGEAYLDRLVAWAAQLFGVPISMTGFADRDRIWFKSSHVLDVTEFDREAEMHAPVGFLSRIACGR